MTRSEARRVAPLIMCLLAGMVTGLLTFVMGVIPAILIGGVGVGIAGRLFVKFCGD